MIDQIFSRTAEEALVGSLMICPQVIEEIDTSPDEMSDTHCRLILEAMRRIQARGEVDGADVISIAEELKRIPGGEEIGGVFGLAPYQSLSESWLHAPAYARIIRDNYKRRAIVEQANKLAVAAYDPSADLDKVVAKSLEALVKQSGNTTGAEPVAKIAAKLIDEVEQAQAKPSDYSGIPTGFRQFDAISGGIQRGEVMMLAGDPGVGKSSFAMQLCAGMAQGRYGHSGTPGAVYQLEMTALTTWRRVIALYAEISSKAMKTGKLKADELDRFMTTSGKLAELPMLISDRTDWTTLGLRSDIAKLKAEHDIGWVLIDYMGLLKDSQELDSTERSAIISDRVHDLAKDFDVAVIALHDLTKAGMTGAVSGQAGLAGSRRVMYNADVILNLKHEGETDSGRVRLEWAKFREDSSNRTVLMERVTDQAAFKEVPVIGGF